VVNDAWKGLDANRGSIVSFGDEDGLLEGFLGSALSFGSVVPGVWKSGLLR